MANGPGGHRPHFLIEGSGETHAFSSPRQGRGAGPVPPCSEEQGNVTGKTSFSAADSALGYLYQVRIALLWALRRFKTDNDFVVSLETLDDVTFESNGCGCSAL
jgi:hypothetical protein